MVGRQRAMPRRQGRAMPVAKLFGVELDGQAVRPGGLENALGLGGREADAFAEDVNRRRQLFLCHGRNHDFANFGNIVVHPPPTFLHKVFQRQGMGAEEVVTIRTGRWRSRAPGGAQHFQFVFERQAIAGLDLDRGHALGQQGIQAGQGGRDQVAFGGGAGGANRR